MALASRGAADGAVDRRGRCRAGRGRRRGRRRRRRAAVGAAGERAAHVEPAARPQRPRAGHPVGAREQPRRDLLGGAAVAVGVGHARPDQRRRARHERRRHRRAAQVAVLAPGHRREDVDAGRRDVDPVRRPGWRTARARPRSSSRPPRSRPRRPRGTARWSSPRCRPPRRRARRAPARRRSRSARRCTASGRPRLMLITLAPRSAACRTAVEIAEQGNEVSAPTFALRLISAPDQATPAPPRPLPGIAAAMPGDVRAVADPVAAVAAAARRPAGHHPAREVLVALVDAGVDDGDPRGGALALRPRERCGDVGAGARARRAVRRPAVVLQAPLGAEQRVAGQDAHGVALAVDVARRAQHVALDGLHAALGAQPPGDRRRLAGRDVQHLQAERAVGAHEPLAGDRGARPGAVRLADAAVPGHEQPALDRRAAAAVPGAISASRAARSTADRRRRPNTPQNIECGAPGLERGRPRWTY